MLRAIGKIIRERPWLIVLTIVVITLGFGSQISSLEMKTSMEHFLPEDEVVRAQERVNDHFGAGYETIMIHIEKQKAKNVVDPEVLREEYFIAKELETFDDAETVLSVAYFVDTICQMEFGKTLKNCSNNEINKAYQDLMAKPPNSKIKMINIDDANEQIDYQPSSKILKGKSIDCMDIKNYYIEEKNDKMFFSIETYDLSHFKNELLPPVANLKVMEWYISFKNLIIQDEQFDVEYKISAHIEPTTPIWEVGNRTINNLRNIVQNIKNHVLFKSFKKDVYLWIKFPSDDFSFPLRLESGEVFLNTNKNLVEIVVEKKELGKYGIATEMNDFILPARLGNSKAGVRYYQMPGRNLPWSRVTINFEYFQNAIENLQKRPLIKDIFGRVLSKFGDFSWDDFYEMFMAMEESDITLDTISLKDLEFLWVESDQAPDANIGDNSFFIKPVFFEDMKNNVITFLSETDEDYTNADAALMMVQINSTLNPEEVIAVSDKIVESLKIIDAKQDLITMSATGSGIIESEINEVTMEANSIIIPIIFVVISLILFISFRKISYVFIPLIGLTVSFIWLFGTMVLLGMSFMIMTVGLIPMLMGLGVDYSVHTFHNYRAGLWKGETPGKAMQISIQDVGMAMLLATITTFIAFLSFLTVSMIPLRDFGVLCAIGIAYVFLITITLQASIRYIFDRRKKIDDRLKPKKNVNGRIMRKIAKIILNHPRSILFITLLITVFMVFSGLNIKTGFRTEDFLPEENPSVIVMNDISEKFPFSSQEQEYILIEGDVATVNAMNGIVNTLENLIDDEHLLLTIEGKPKTKSVLSVIEKMMQENSSIATEFNIGQNNIPGSDRDVRQLFDYMYESDIYGFETSEVLHRHKENYDATLIIIFTTVMSSGSENMNQVMGNLYQDLNEDINNGFGDARAIVTGESSSTYIIINSMIESQLISTGICIILAAVVLVLVYRKLTLGLITMIPVSISTIWIIGTMHLIGYSLNVMTIMITTLTIGLGITYAIHAVERFRLTADRTGDVFKAVSETVGHTGGALMIAAITTIAGFGILVLTPLPMEQQFGLITAITIFFAFLTSIFVLPPVLMFWGKWRKKTKGYIISPGKPKDI